MNILHIHSDCKFLNLTDSFQDESFNNRILIIGDKIQNIRSNYSYEIEKDINKIIRLINNYDIVVMYNLDFLKSYITNRIAEDKIVLWRFFGLELYHRIPNQVLSIQTKKYQKKKNWFRNLIKRTYFYLKYQTTQDKEFVKAMKRVNGFVGICKEEYSYLCNFFTLPKYIQLSYQLNEFIGKIKEDKVPSILIGNNRSTYNNHLEIIDILAKYKNVNKYLFLNYGVQGKYYKAVLKKIENREDFIAIQNFLSKEEFNTFYDKLDVFVLNGYRQMAVANIFTALRYGVKVYMNKKNSYYFFLINNGFPIFEIENLDEDVRNKNFYLSFSEIAMIKKAFVNLSINYSSQNFINAIKNLPQ